jgi:hypothetical protein
MVERNEGDRTPTEGGADEGERLDLSDAFADRAPRVGMEDDVVRRLRAEGLLASGRGRGGAPARVWLLRVAASVMLFAAGWSTSALVAGGGREGEATNATPAIGSAGGEAYMLLMWEGDDYVEETVPGERATEYAAWARSVAGRGIPVSGRELGPTVERLGPTDITVASAPTRVTGYFVLETSAAEAAELAGSHPHRTHGGWVEVVPLR